jgi:steroid delta-isomerase-like uncharacterized protein
MQGFGQESRPLVLNVSLKEFVLASLAKQNPQGTNSLCMLKFIGSALFVLLFICSCNEGQKNNELDNQEIANRSALIAFLDQGWNKKDLSVIDQYFSDDIVRKVNNVNLASSKNELSANLQVYFTGFPDLKIELDNMISDGNQIYISWTLNGTNTGLFGELPPTGKKIKIRGISRMEFDDKGKILLEEVSYNELSLLQQLGHTLSPPVLE